MSHTQTLGRQNQSAAEDCIQFAQRAAHLLMDLGRRMEGKWEDAPQSLLEKILELET
jgi:hypothetical protein